MSDLQHRQVPETVPSANRRSAAVMWLAGGLALALIAVLALGAWVYVDHHQNAAQQAAVAAVTAYVDGVNGNDIAAVTAAQTSDSSWMSVADGSVVDGPYRADALVSQERDWLSSGLVLTTVGAPLVVGDHQVVVQTHATFTQEPSAGGWGAITYTLRDDGSGAKVSSVVFTMTSGNG